MYEDEATFQVSGTISRTWAEKGKEKGLQIFHKACRESVKAFGVVTAEENPRFNFRFAEVFNASTFLSFLKHLVRHYDRKIYLVLDNARYHHAILLRDWLEDNREKIELHFLPAYYPDLNAQEYVWRVTRRKATHNRYFPNKSVLHGAIFRRFNRFQGNPASLRSAIASFKVKVPDDGKTIAG